MLGEKKTAKNKTINSLKCPYCAKKSASKVNLRVHLKECHTKPELRSPMNKKMIKLVEEEENKANCEPATTLQEKIYQSEMFKCQKCDFNSKTKDEIDKHTEIHKKANILSEKQKPRNTKKFKCQKCELCFETDIKLRMHMQTVHQELTVQIKTQLPKVIKCKMCDFKCKYNIQLKKAQGAKTHYGEKI